LKEFTDFLDREKAFYVDVFAEKIASITPFCVARKRCTPLPERLRGHPKLYDVWL